MRAEVDLMDELPTGDEIEEKVEISNHRVFVSDQTFVCDPPDLYQRLQRDYLKPVSFLGTYSRWQGDWEFPTWWGVQDAYYQQQTNTFLDYKFGRAPVLERVQVRFNLRMNWKGFHNKVRDAGFEWPSSFPPQLTFRLCLATHTIENSGAASDMYAYMQQDPLDCPIWDCTGDDFRLYKESIVRLEFPSEYFFPNREITNIDQASGNVTYGDPEWLYNGPLYDDRLFQWDIPMNLPLQINQDQAGNVDFLPKIRIWCSQIFMDTTYIDLNDVKVVLPMLNLSFTGIYRKSQ